MLDVGQGLAMVIEREGAALLYDTGLAWPRETAVSRSLFPGYAGIICSLKASFSAMSISITAAGSIR
jgi:beta-lactamase superfamily II metal-dependent hydrolase